MLKQGPNEPVDSYYSRFKRIIKRIDAGTASLQDAQKLYYFKKGLRAEILPILLTHIPADLATLLGLARTYEQRITLLLMLTLVQALAKLLPMTKKSNN